VHEKHKVAKCMAVGDLMLHNFGAERTDKMVQCFQGIKTEQLHRVEGKRDLGSAESVIIHMGSNDLRTTKKLDFVLGEIYDLVATAKRKLLNCRIVLSGVLRRRDWSRRRIGELNDRFVGYQKSWALTSLIETPGYVD